MLTGSVGHSGAGGVDYMCGPDKLMIGHLAYNQERLVPTGWLLGTSRLNLRVWKPPT